MVYVSVVFSEVLQVFQKLCSIATQKASPAGARFFSSLKGREKGVPAQKAIFIIFPSLKKLVIKITIKF